jgi:hypothetical protein
MISGQSLAGWREVYEVLSGLCAITLIWLSVFLSYHLVIVGSQRQIWRRWRKLPLSIHLAGAILVIACSSAVMNFVMWLSRFTNNSVLTFRDIDSIVFISATVVFLIGCLWVLRVITRPMLGPWPWWGATGTAAVYLSWSVWRFL